MWGWLFVGQGTLAETATHGIKNCFVSHGGRTLHHDAVARANNIIRLGYEVLGETVPRQRRRMWKP